VTRISYLNGEFIDHDKAFVHIEDRGFQFADAVYEGIAFFNGKILDLGPHMVRLKRSLSELSIQFDVEGSNLEAAMEKLIARNDLSEGFIYLQISRGRAPRNYAFPNPPVKPTVVLTVSPLDMKAIQERQKNGVKIILVEENRWSRPDIKSTSLLGNILAKEAAWQADAYEAVYVDRDGFVTEGTSSNIWMITRDDILLTRKTDGAILAGVTRGSMMKAVSGVEQRRFTREELLAAKAAFLTGTTTFVMPVVQIDGEKIGDEKPGPLLEKLVKIYADYIKAETGFGG